jgi:asparagine synthase (glutamine-hydrolysing)
MPEHQRKNQLNGRWDADWHQRILRQRADYLAELDRIADDPRLAQMIDLERLREALEDFPDHTTLDMKRKFTIEFALPRGLLAARFVRWVEGRN